MVKTKKCKKCGKIFQPRHKNQKFCKECIDKKVKVRCAHCNTVFILGNGPKQKWLRGETEFYCSSECANANKITARKRHQKICVHCGNKFIGTSNQQYCDKCLAPIKVKCATCGKLIALNNRQIKEKLNGRDKFYCSYTCAGISEDVRNKAKETYKAKTGYKNSMQNPDVRKKRESEYKEKTGYKNPSQNPEVQSKKRKNYKEKTGYDNPSQNPEIKKKKIQTSRKHYGCDHPMQNQIIYEKVAATLEAKTGYKCLLSIPQVREKGMLVYKNKTGYDNPGQNPEVQAKAKATHKANTGYEYPGQNPETKRKAADTLARNGNRSKPELLFEQKAKEQGLVKNKDYFVEYYDKERYPFHCDFYIPDNDLFVELNVYWSHGKHWYNSCKYCDQTKLKLWQKKANKSPHYRDAVNVWTKRDPNKRAAANKNSLNYVTLWTLKDIEEWFALGMPIGQDWRQEYSWKE